MAAFVWGAATLLAIEPKRVDADVMPAVKDVRRLLMVLDVSPSMNLADAGPTHTQRRGRRGGDLMTDVLGRVGLGKCRASVVASYSDAKPVAVDVSDVAVLDNIFRDLPLDQAFEPGPSELFKGLASAFELAKGWPAHSTTLAIITDGQVAPATGMPERPPAIADAVVVGVGDPAKTTFIAGHGSRQDGSALLQLATRLGGTYVDCNSAPLPATAFKMLTQAVPARDRGNAGLRELALSAAGAGGALVAAVPVGLGFLETLRRRISRHPAGRNPAPVGT